MNILKEILAEAFLITEDVSAEGNAIENAVVNMHPARITYDGPSGEGKGEREIYPVAYGLSTAGNPVVRAFQPKGATSSEVPSWKFFRIDRIGRWENDNSRTFDPKDLNGFNETGDEQIETLYAISPINGAQASGEEKPSKEKPQEPEKTITSHPVVKGEVENGGADANTEQNYYTANDAVRDIMATSNPKISPDVNKNVDNMAGQNDISPENQPAPEPVPMTKMDVSGPEVNNEPTDGVNQDLYANDGPVTKTDVDRENISDRFRNLTDRMDNLYKDEEEEEM